MTSDSSLCLFRLNKILQAIVPSAAISGLHLRWLRLQPDCTQAIYNLWPTSVEWSANSGVFSKIMMCQERQLTTEHIALWKGEVDETWLIHRMVKSISYLFSQTRYCANNNTSWDIRQEIISFITWQPEKIFILVLMFNTITQLMEALAIYVSYARHYHHQYSVN